MNAVFEGSLLPAEREIVSAAERGDPANFLNKPDDQRFVRAPLLRSILLGQRIVSDDKIARVCPLLPEGLRIIGAIIQNSLQLSHCSGPKGGRLPGLSFEDCEITGTVDFTNARLSRLSLKGCRIGTVLLRGAQLDAPFDFSLAHPASEEPGGPPAWIDAHGCIVRGGIVGDGARLRAPSCRVAKDVPLGREHYALRLSEALIEGSVRLADGFQSIGGVTIENAHIRGDLLAKGASFEAGEKRALCAQSTMIDGGAVLIDATAFGTIWISGARIGGSVDCTNAKLFEGEHGRGVGPLFAANAKIGDGLYLRRGFRAEGRVSLLGVQVGGTFACDGGHFMNPKHNSAGAALLAENMKVGGSVSLRDGFRAEGKVVFDGAKIEGELNCTGGRFAALSVDGKGTCLDAENIEVRGSIFLGRSFAAERLEEDFSAEGGVSLVGAKVGGSLKCSGAKLRNYGTDDAGKSLNLKNAEIGANLLLDDVESVGNIVLWGCQIGGDLDCTNAIFIAWPITREIPHHEASAIDATNIVISGDVILDHTTVLGRIMFEHAEIHGGLRWEDIKFPVVVRLEGAMPMNGAPSAPDTLWSYQGRVINEGKSVCPQFDNYLELSAGISLSHSRIGTTLKAYSLSSEVPLLINLAAARVYTLDDDKSRGERDRDRPSEESEKKTIGFPMGWGNDGANGKPVTSLNLDGFVYNRIEYFPTASAPESRLIRWWREKLQKSRLIRWLHYKLQTLGAAAESSIKRAPKWLQHAFRNLQDLLKLPEPVTGQDIAGPRLKWLERQQHRREDAFFPQPYSHLAALMRASGHIEAARAVEIAKANATPYSFWLSLWRVAFGFGFGHGLSPWKASRALLIAWLIGTILVWSALTQTWKSPQVANAKPILVLTADREAALAAEQQLILLNDDKAAKSLTKDFLIYPILPGERPCGFHDIQPMFYAVDMMIPVVPLHQEDRCEIAARQGTTIWQILWATFSIFGKIVTSLALITYSGVLKPKDS